MNNNKTKSAEQRKKLERKKKRDRGLVPVEVWIHPERKEELKEKEKEWQKDKKSCCD